MITSTVHQPRSGRRVVRRRRPALDAAYDVALSELPPELRPAMVAYVTAKRHEYEARLVLSTAMTRHGVRWHQVDDIARHLAYGRR